MRPFYFGDSKRPLFGAYEAAAAPTANRRAVLLCYPFGVEYLRSHRAFRELAHRLSKAGIHALRFDFYGCGDSSGSSDEGTLDLWIDDIRFALDELREASGVARPSILGLRFGATLAALASNSGVATDQLLLWDPIVNGREYLEELSDRHHRLIASRPRPADYIPAEPPVEALGTPLSSALRAGIEKIDLMALPGVSARRVLVLGDGSGSERLDAFQRGLEACGASVARSSVASTAVWLKQDEMDRTLVPLEILDLFVRQLREDAA
jgi:alpha/beta superfamily hydrolase